METLLEIYNGFFESVCDFLRPGFIAPHMEEFYSKKFGGHS